MGQSLDAEKWLHENNGPIAHTDDLQQKLYDNREIRVYDNHFHIIALNLSGNREALEKRAMELIEKHGYLKSLKMSRPTNGGSGEKTS